MPNATPKSSRSRLAAMCFAAGCILMVTGSANAQEARLMFSSDFHDNLGDFTAAVTQVCGGASCDAVALVGDYNPYSGSGTGTAGVLLPGEPGYDDSIKWPQSSIGNLVSILNAVSSVSTDTVLAGGNHDIQLSRDGQIHQTGSVTQSLDGIGQWRDIEENELYDMWVINFEDFGKYAGEQSDARDALESHIISHPNRVHFILGHYPLHTIRDSFYVPCPATCSEHCQSLGGNLVDGKCESGLKCCDLSGNTEIWDTDTAPTELADWPDAGEALFNLLNTLGKKYNIVFLWGHNHHEQYTDNVNYAARPGDNPCTVDDDNIAEICKSTLTFSYLNAGYMADSAYTVITVDDDHIFINRSDYTEPRAPVLRHLGDVNHDGTVNIVDALLIAQAYVGLAPDGFDAYVGDVNEDGNVNIVDALIIAQYYVNLIPALPARNSGATIEDGERYFFE